MKIKLPLFISLLFFNALAIAQTISCSSVFMTGESHSLNYPDPVAFNMVNANTRFTVLTKPKGVLAFTQLALGNGVTNIPDNYNLQHDGSNSDDEWDAWTTVQNVEHTNRTAFHIIGHPLRKNIEGANPGDLIHIYLKGLPSNNTYSPTPKLMVTKTAVSGGHKADFPEFIIVDDIVAGETTQIDIGTIQRGGVNITDTDGSTSSKGMPTDNPDVTIDLFDDLNNTSISLAFGNSVMQISDYLQPVKIMALIKPNANAIGEYKKNLTATVNCP